MQKEALIQLLETGRYISGAWLAKQLGISRAAVAKVVAGLRSDGYRIEAAPRRGYCLQALPKQLSQTAIRSLLKGHPSAEQTLVYLSLDSTNAQLKRLAADGAPAGTVVLAEAQTAGKGRMGRSFLSDPNVGVYLSFLLRPEAAPSALMTLTSQAAVAAMRAVETSCGMCPDIKWVNDLQLHGKKICGILTELSIEAESGRVGYAIVGVGINCNQQAAGFPPELREIAGSILSETGRTVDRNRLAAALIRNLSALPELDWQKDYRERCITLGRKVTVRGPDGEKDALALDIGPQAELLVRYADGSTSLLNSGEVTLHRE